MEFLRNDQSASADVRAAVTDYTNCLGLNSHDIKIIFLTLGNHMQHNNTSGRYQEILNGNDKAFVDAEAWYHYNLWCIENLKK